MSVSLQLALTGGIASGKTFVADELERLGAFIIDADVLARKVVAPGSSGLREVEQRFGKDVILPDGALDRAALGAIIFADDHAREDLNAIIHPRVRLAAKALAAQAPAGATVIHVIPLLVETGQAADFDAVIVVDIPVKLQQERLMSRNNFTREQAQARIAAQASREQRLAAADYVIDNSGSKNQTQLQVARLWEELTKKVGSSR